MAASLETCCDAAIGDRLKLPIGSWLTDALLSAAYDQHGEVAKHAALCLGLPESTFRRQLERVQTARASGQLQYHELFLPVVPNVEQLVRCATASEHRSALLEQGKQILLRLVHERLPEDVGFASALMGVTPPTYRRHLAGLKQEAA